jgi:hypothetical protein
MGDLSLPTCGDRPPFNNNSNPHTHACTDTGRHPPQAPPPLPPKPLRKGWGRFCSGRGVWRSYSRPRGCAPERKRGVGRQLRERERVCVCVCVPVCVYVRLGVELGVYVCGYRIDEDDMYIFIWDDLYPTSHPFTCLRPEGQHAAGAVRGRGGLAAAVAFGLRAVQPALDARLAVGVPVVGDRVQHETHAWMRPSTIVRPSFLPLLASINQQSPNKQRQTRPPHPRTLAGSE